MSADDHPATMTVVDRKLDGRVAIVTGGGSGIGRASAQLFAAHGARVVVADLDPAAAAATVATLTCGQEDAVAVACDVADVSALRALVDLVRDRFGALHVLFNNVGIPGAGGLDISEAEWDQSIGVNLKSAFFLTGLAMPLLTEAGGAGSIIYTSSTAGLVASPYSPLYSLTKAGVIGLMRCVAVASASDGVRANAICPGVTETAALPGFFGRDLADDASAGAVIKERISTFSEQTIPLGRIARPQEMAAAALFLASDDAAFVTGVALPVDGGYVAR